MSKAAGGDCSRAEIARICGVAVETIDRWLARGMPIRKQGGRGVAHKFNAAEVIDWRIARATAKREEVSSDVLDLEEARARKVAAEAESAELDLAARLGELVEVDTVAELVESAFATVRLRLLSVPSKVAPRIASIRSAAKCRRMLEDEFREALDELVDGGLLSASAAKRDREKRSKKGDRKRGRAGTTSAA